MIKRFFALATLLLAFAATPALLILGATPARAQAVEGCDPDVLRAMETTAQARVAYSNSVDDEIFEQDDSVLAMTCFNQAAAISSDAGGTFSGPFTSELAPVVEDALAAMYDDYANSMGNQRGAHTDSGGATTMYSPATTQLTTPAGGFDCAAINNMWEAMEEEGINTNVPYVTFSDLVNGAGAGGTTPTLPPGTPDPDSDFARNWEADSSQIAFRELGDAMTQLDDRGTTVPDFSGDQTPCEVMRTLDNTVTCP